MTVLDRFGTRLIGIRTALSSEHRALNDRSGAAVVVRNAPAGVMVAQNWSPRDQPMPEQYSGQQSVNNAYASEMYVYRCVDLIANNLASLPFRAGNDLEHKGSFKLNAPLAKLLGPAPGSPNPVWSPASLWRYVAAQWTVLGKTAFAIGRDENGEINALWPMAVQYLRPILGNGTGDFPFTAYEWMTPGQPGYRRYTTEQVLYLWRPSLKDPLQPESVIEAAQLNISVLRMIEMYEYQFLRNNAEPSTLVTTKPFAEPEMRRAFRDQFVSEMTGYANAGKTMFVETGDEDDPNGGGKVSDSISVERIGLTQAESQHSENRDAKKDDVCVAFGVPLSLLGDSTQSKFQNYDQDLRTFWTGTMTNLMRELGDVVNTFVAPLFGREVGWFDVTKIASLQPPRTFKPEDAVELVTSRLISRDEYRNDLGLPPWAEVDPENLPVIYPGTTSTPAGGEVQTVGSDATGATTDDPTRPLEIPAVTPAADPMAPTPQQPTPLSAARARRAQRAILTRLDQVEQRQLETRSEARHGGEGHQHVTSGHVTSSTPPAQVKAAFESMMTASVQSLLAEQADQAQARLLGRRGRRAAADATTHVEALYDAKYWEARTTAMLEPFFSGLSSFKGGGMKMSMPTDAAKSLGTDITAMVATNLGLAMTEGGITPTVVSGTFATATQQAATMVAEAMAQFGEPATVERAAVEQALLDVHSGRTSLAEALAAVGAA